MSERSVTLKEAKRRALEATSELGLSPNWEEFDDNGSGPTAWACGLVGFDGIKPVYGEGLGKGNRAEAKVGALFEALEHFLTGPVGFHPEDVYLRRAGDVMAGVLGKEASADVLLQTSDHKLACCSYKNLHTGEEIDVPFYLSAAWYVDELGASARSAAGDDFGYRHVARYATNSGSAIGVTKDEATVHAINEVIERDAFSLFLVRAFFGNEPPMVVPSEDLPDQLADLFRYVQERIGSKLYLIDIATEADVPAFLAYADSPGRQPHTYGAGASLDSFYAAYRALSEILQSHLWPGLSTEESQARLDLLREVPDLYRCGVFDLTELLSSAKQTSFPEPTNFERPEDHLAELEKRVQAAGFSIYQRVIRTLSNGLAVVHVLIPGMEKLMGITAGVPIVPGRRAIQALCRQGQ